MGLYDSSLLLHPQGERALGERCSQTMCSISGSVFELRVRKVPVPFKGSRGKTSIQASGVWNKLMINEGFAIRLMFCQT